MDTILCDELVQEIFHRLPPPCSAAVSLVSKRWRRLLRSSTTSLSLYFPPPYNPTTVTLLSVFLSGHRFLSSLSIAAEESGGDHLLAVVSSSCPNLRRLRFLSSPVSPFSLYTLSTSCIHLSSISVTISRPLCFNWIPCFESLKNLSLILTNPLIETDDFEFKDSAFDVELSLESLCVSGILAGDYGLSYLWKNSKNLKKLQLKSCESLGDNASFSGFLKLLHSLQELELRSCRIIIDGVLLKLTENCVSLNSLLIYDGGNREGLLHFITNSKCSLKKLDLRLPLDLDNTHLIALSENLYFRGLTSLMLQSCCLVTGEGLKAVARAIGNGLEDFSLVNCDLLEKESGLLATLGQDLRKLRKLNLSYNDMLLDKEIVSMLVSCDRLEELKLRGCSKLTNAVLGSIVSSCKKLESLDVMFCCGIDMQGIEFVMTSLPRLRRLEMEESKLPEAARMRAAERRIEVVSGSTMYV